jgi:AraC-like DNA-binding protein
MEPVLAGAIGRFQEQRFASGRNENFAAIWTHELPLDEALPIIVAPDGSIDLQWINGDLRVAGPDREPLQELLPAGVTVIGFRFRPAAAAAWLGVPASELVGQRLALKDIWGSKARSLADKIWKLRGDGDLISGLEIALADCVTDRPIDATMRVAYSLIEAGPPPGAPLVPWLARSLAVSERTLRRRFDACFGYGPKTLDRILRYQRFQRLTRTSRSPMALIAAEAGYADQAHLTRESRRLSGVTPKEHFQTLGGTPHSRPRLGQNAILPSWSSVIGTT